MALVSSMKNNGFRKHFSCSRYQNTCLLFQQKFTCLGFFKIMFGNRDLSEFITKFSERSFRSLEFEKGTIRQSQLQCLLCEYGRDSFIEYFTDV